MYSYQVTDFTVFLQAEIYCILTGLINSALLHSNMVTSATFLLGYSN